MSVSNDDARNDIFVCHCQKRTEKCDTKDYFQIIPSCCFFISFIFLAFCCRVSLWIRLQWKRPFQQFTENIPAAHFTTTDSLNTLVGIPFISELIIKCTGNVFFPFLQFSVAFYFLSFLRMLCSSRVNLPLAQF